MKNAVKLFFAFTILFSFTSSVLARDYAERLMDEKYRKALNMGCENMEVKNPSTAVVFGLLPGGGSFYTGQIGLAIADVILWPVSPLWDAPLAYNRAIKTNKEETIYTCEQEKGQKL